ncbi:MAG: hypothetical protein Q8Q20_05720 [bacterium]|nr:hypothetical protein [bacterium]
MEGREAGEHPEDESSVSKEKPVEEMSEDELAHEVIRLIGGLPSAWKFSDINRKRGTLRTFRKNVPGVGEIPKDN